MGVDCNSNVHSRICTKILSGKQMKTPYLFYGGLHHHIEIPHCQVT